MSARKRATPKGSKKKPKSLPGAKSFTVNGHRVGVRESARSVVITIDGQVIPGVRKLVGGEYHSLFLPFRGYPSATTLARALASQVGSTLVLDEVEAPTSKPRKATKRKSRGRS